MPPRYTSVCPEFIVHRELLEKMNKQQKYIADVNRLGLKSVVVEAFSSEEALKKLIEKWGEENIIIPPAPAVSQEQIDLIESSW